MVYYEDDNDYCPYDEMFERIAHLNIRANRLTQDGHVYEAFDVSEESVFLARKHLKPDSELRLIVHSTLASVHRQKGRYREAEGLDRVVLGVRRTILATVESEAAAGTGPSLAQIRADDPYPYVDVAQALRTLAQDLNGQGRYGGGLALQMEAADIMEHHAQPDDPRTLSMLSIRHSLANSDYQTGRHAEAAPMHARALDSIAAMDTLGTDYVGLGETPERAMAIQEEALATARKHLGATNTTTIQCAINLASTYLRAAAQQAEQLEKPEKTEPEKPELEPLEQAIAMLRELYDNLRPPNEEAGELNTDDYSPLTIGLMNALGVAYLAAKRTADAEPLLERCYAWNKQVLGLGHPNTRGSLANLETLWVEMGELVLTEIIPREALTGGGESEEEAGETSDEPDAQCNQS